MFNVANRLVSAIGVYDGNVYEKLWERAQTEPLNQAEVTEGYEVTHFHHKFDAKSDIRIIAEYQASPPTRQVTC